MGKKSGPPAPDYVGAAREQAAGDQRMLDRQTTANRPDVYTPWGSQTWTKTTTGDSDHSGEDRWSSTISLTPQQQRALDDQMAIQEGRSGAARSLLSQASSAFQTPFSWGSIPAVPQQIQARQLGTNTANPNMPNMSGPQGTPSEWRQRGQQAALDFQKPLFDEQRTSLENQLANQGLSRGSEAWNREMRRVDDAQSRAALQAFDSGRQESSMLFGQDLSSRQFENLAAQQNFQNLMALAQQGDQRAAQELEMQIRAGSFNQNLRQQGISEEQMRRSMPLNELNALLTGQQVQNPNMPQTPMAGRAQGPDLLGAAQQQYNAGLDSFNARMNNLNQLGQLGSNAAMMYFMFSDARLKEAIEYTGDSIGGVPVVHYRYRGLPGRFVGVIAQDALRVRPDVVALHPSGYLMVNYLGLLA
jgi:hypothetical protein